MRSHRQWACFLAKAPIRKRLYAVHWLNALLAASHTLPSYNRLRASCLCGEKRAETW